MKPHTAFFTGIRQVFRYWKMWGGLYIINLVFALITVMPLKWLFEATLGNSMQVDALLKGFNFEVISDFLNTNGGFLSPILNQSLWIIFLFALLYIFLTGGILHALNQYPHSIKATSFWGHSGHYFWRVFRLTLYFLFTQGLVLIILGWIFLTVVRGLSSETFGFDMAFVKGLKIFLPIYLLFAFLISLLQHYAKIHLVDQDSKSVFYSIARASRIVRKNFFNVFFLYLLNLVAFLLILGIYWLIQQCVSSESGSSILILFIIGQFFILARIGMQLINLGSAMVVYKEVSGR